MEGTEVGTHHDSTLAPPSIPMSTDIADPITLPPDARPNTDSRIKLHAHLKIPFQKRFRDREAARASSFTLKALHHIMITLLVRLGLRGCSGH